MTPKKLLYNALQVPCVILLSALSVQNATAQSVKDSTTRLLASADKKVVTRTYTVREANVVFPDILKGNEAETMDYIEKFSINRKDYLLRMHKKGKLLLPKAAKILKKHQLPEELKVLLTLESAYNGKAVSKAGAVGYWQFMDAVAKEYGLKYVPQEKPVVEKVVAGKKGQKKAQPKLVETKKEPVGPAIKKDATNLVDDRTNFNKATVAAARYLRDRRMNLDDNWLLVVASYNCGVGNVWNAMERSGKKNPTFWDIKKLLPAETQSYVMNFITLNVIFANYDNFVKNKLIFKSETMAVPENLEELAPEEITETGVGKL